MRNAHETKPKLSAHPSPQIYIYKHTNTQYIYIYISAVAGGYHAEQPDAICVRDIFMFNCNA